MCICSCGGGGRRQGPCVLFVILAHWQDMKLASVVEESYNFIDGDVWELLACWNYRVQNFQGPLFSLTCDLKGFPGWEISK